MPNILILGATGYIGLPLSLTLLRTGSHHVFGLARNTERAALLAQNEITPIQGDLNSPKTWIPALERYAIDVVVDCSSAYETAGAVLEGVVEEAGRRKELLRKYGVFEQGEVGGAVGPKMGFVYVSGNWVHGSSAPPNTTTTTTTIGGMTSDMAVPGSRLALAEPARAVAWRPAHEQKVLAVRGLLDVAVVRPGVVYGRSSWIWDGVWGAVGEAKSKGETKARVPLDPGALATIVHVDDVAEGLEGVVRRLGMLGSWPVFDLVAERVDGKALVEGVGKVLGFEGEVEFVGSGGNPMFEAMSMRQNSDAERARLMLGWVARRGNMLMRLESIVRAWEAAQVAKETKS